ncbi:MAG: type II secretion system secretin GspD [Thermodesulfobacteriota bacterium]|nr:MAG: type II secretion system secretin GspD [Thermodesulfobacteriota bacterium]
MKVLRRSSILIILLALTVTLASVSTKSYGAGDNVGSRSPARMVTIQFVDVEISSVVRIMSEITGKNFIFDGGLKGRVTIVAPAKLTVDDAMRLFVTALELKNYALLPSSGNAYKIIPLSVAKQSGAKVITGPGGLSPEDSFIVRFIPLEFISNQEALRFIQPFISRYGQISSFGSRNALLVVDTAGNVEKILKIINSLNKPPDVTEPEIIYLKYAQADDVATLLATEARMMGVEAKGTKGSSEDMITSDIRLNAVILSGPAYLREHLKRFISNLDIPPPETSNRINVYYLENANAEDMAKTLESLTRNTAQPTSKRPSGGRIVQELSGGINITPDKTSNALIIMASPADYRTIEGVIKKLDRRPRQILVEAMITEVSIDKAIELGVKWRMTAEMGGAPVAVGGVGTIDSSLMSDILNGLAGLSLGGLGNFITVPVTASDGSTFNLTAPGFATLFSLSELKDAINVLSTPHILTSDNAEAEIVVGENVPFLSSIERSSETTGQPLLQSIERQDVGIKLKIKPKISEEGYVKLEIYQEISAIQPTTTTGASDLITSKRSARTTVVVKNNQTVVIGGLIQNKKTSSISKVPILGDIPLMGWLFKSKSEKVEKTNVLVFMTPHIIDSYEGFEAIKKKKVEEFERESGVTERRGEK